MRVQIGPCRNFGCDDPHSWLKFFAADHAALDRDNIAGLGVPDLRGTEGAAASAPERYREYSN